MQAFQSSLDSFFSPRSIAIVGASDTPMKIGAIPLSYQLQHGFDGALYPINPGRQVVQGLPAYPTLQAVGKPIDLAIFAVPASQVDAAMDDAIQAKVGNIVMFSAGYAEVDDAGREAQERLVARARAAGIRMLGPNCLGFMNLRKNVYATFSPVLMAARARAGGIAVVSQSGAFGAYAYAMARERGLGLSYWATTGNEADIQVADCIAWLASDPATRVILAYLEGCRDGERLKQALAAARDANKPVVIVKVGRTSLGASAAASHTASLAGDDAVYDALFRQYGVWRAHSIEEFFSIGYALSVAPRPANDKVGLLTVSGGVGALMADDASLAGLQVSPMPEPAQRWIREQVPFAAAGNPVDITGQVTSQPELIGQTARLMLEQGYGSLIIFLAAGGLSQIMRPHLQAMATELTRDFPDRTLVYSSLFSAEHRDEFQAQGITVFEDPGTAIRSVAALNFFARNAGGPVPETPPAPMPAANLSLADACTEHEALELLAANGIPIVPTRIADSLAQAQQAADELGYPVVIKIVSPDIPHKSDVGGVRLNIANADALREAYAHMLATVAKAMPQARIDGVLVAPMVGDGVECILGTQRDPVFGPVVMFGLGGVNVELLKDVSLRLAPVSLDQAHAMIREVRSYPLLNGYRGRQPIDLDALALAIVRLSELAWNAQTELDSIDVNPFLARPAGHNAMALDALVVPRKTANQ